jgi:predicted RNase H-like nuclease
VTSPKKLRGRVHEPGMVERRARLRAAGLVPSLLAGPAPRGAGEDDRLDACALLVVARRVAAGVALCFPDPPERDRFGLPIAIRA